MRIGKKAILFDRDGVLNIDSGYVYRYENIRWIDGCLLYTSDAADE